MKHEKSVHAAPLTPAQSGRRVLPLWPERWHVVSSDGRRPLWLPIVGARVRSASGWLGHFVCNPYRAFYTQALIALNNLAPRAGVLPELRLPRAMRNALSFELPVRGPWRAAIQIGSAGPHQKVYVLFISPQGEGLALAKVAMAESGDAMVLAEARWLKELAGIPALAPQVPRLIVEGTTRQGRRYLATSVAPSTRETSTFTPAHAGFLARLGRARLSVARFDASPCLQRVEHALERLHWYGQMELHDVLQHALQDCRRRLARWNGPFVLAQGDFAPSNIRVHRDALFVFDWEYAREGASPLADIFHYLLMPRALAGRFGGSLLAEALQRALELARQLYSEWAWSPRIVSTLALAYLVEMIARRALAHQCIDRADPVVGSCWSLMAHRAEWLTP